MVTPFLAILNRPLPDRKLKLFVVGIGLTFWFVWGAALLLLLDGHPAQALESCSAIDDAGIFWDCSSGKAAAILATTVNTLIVITLAMPVFVMAFLVEPSVLPLALPGLAFHLVGMPAGMFVLVRSLRRLVERARP